MNWRLCLLVVVAALSAVMSNLQMVAAGTSISETIQGFLVPQNEARSQVGVPPLKWDVKLTNYARTYARERRVDCLLQHSDGPFGENISWGSGRGWNTTEVVGAWVDEKKWYNYADNSCSSGQDCSHYTQIVRRTTTKVGCAIIRCNSGDTFIICNYYPPGNFVGDRPFTLILLFYNIIYYPCYIHIPQIHIRNVYILNDIHIHPRHIFYSWDVIAYRFFL